MPKVKCPKCGSTDIMIHGKFTDQYGVVVRERPAIEKLELSDQSYWAEEPRFEC
jgi:hypothetical protein